MEEKHRNLKPGRGKELAGMLALMFIAYVLLHDLLGGTLFAHSDLDSYTLQALAWRGGRLDLGQNYPWLELAVYQGKYYVSFPPTPTLFVLPLTFFFGEATPNNFLIMLIAMGCAVTAYFILCKAGLPSLRAMFCALFYLFGSNMLWMSTNGGVWFLAQGCNLLFLSLTLLCALYNKRIPAYLFAALAVGCRPFSVFAFLPLFVFFLEKDRSEGKTLRSGLRAQLPAFVLPVLIAAAYMALNYARFGSVLEFGHNYLPEFTESEYGQFSLRYLADNLYRLFLLPVRIEGGRLRFPYFNGFMFYIANPLFLLMFFQLLRKSLRRKGPSPWPYTRGALLLAMLSVILSLCLHKTLGGWQFGARYTVDMLPLALGIILSYGAWEPRFYEYVVMALGVMFNFYGCMAIQLFS